MNRTLSIITRLLADDGCPWDRRQTPITLIRYLIEEAYELQEALYQGDDDAICEELGDTWFQMIFLIHLLEKKRNLSFQTMAEKNAEKMIRRHPHVFGEGKADTEEEVKKKWKEIKRQEKKEKERSLLDKATSGTPPLNRARDVSKLTADRGFDWDNMAGVMEKVGEEWGEFGEAMTSKEKEAASMEFGDLLFTLVNVARFAGIDPETALASSVAKFEKRYRLMEKILAQKGLPVDRSVCAKEVDEAWDEAKKKEEGPL